MKSKLKGLTRAEVEKRVAEGKVNITKLKGVKTIPQILKDNIFTYFNLLNVILATIIILVGSYKNVTFMAIVAANAVIGIIQEVRAKKAVEKLTIISTPKVCVIRDGEENEIDIHNIVTDDILVIKAGEQVPSDCTIVEGEVEVNESLLTGESDVVLKIAGSKLYSGSSVFSGECTALVTAVGEDNYCEKIASEGRRVKRVDSQIMNSLNGFIKVMSVFIVPIGILLFLKQFFLLDDTLASCITSAVGAMLGMIPNGLILLTSLVFAASVIRFALGGTLVREMYGIEQLARIDVLCLDKTGTITEGRVVLNEVIPVNCSKEQAENLLKRYTGGLDDHNSTYVALLDYTGKAELDAVCCMPFSSERKWSGVSFADGSIIVGAAEFVLADIEKEVKEQLVSLSEEGARVLVLAHSNEIITDRALPAGLEIKAILVLYDVIKQEAKETLDFFIENGVDIKLISGDSAATVYGIAKRLKLSGAQNYIDVKGLTEEELIKAAQTYSIFGRVMPEQKKIIINALKKQGKKTAMIGDGVNDVPALREADCSCAMASGSAAAGSVANFVLLNNDLGTLYKIVMEGRRAINNVERSASLFLTKTVFSFILSLMFLFIPLPYPFKPIQLTLFNTLLIGIPSFILALEPNKSKVKGGFMRSIFSRALPTAISIIVFVLASSLIGSIMNLSAETLSTMALLLAAACGFILLIDTCLPFNKLRVLLVSVLFIIFVGAVYFFGESFFMLSAITPQILIFVGVGILVGIPMYIGLKKVSTKLFDMSAGLLKKLARKNDKKA